MVDFEIDKAEVLRYLGYREGSEQLTDDMATLIDRCIAVTKRAIEYHEATSPILNIEIRDGKAMIDTLELVGSDIKAHLANCDRAILMAVTLGANIDMFERRMQATDITSAVIIDAVSNVAIEEVANICEAKLREMVTRQGLYMTGRYSPGYGDMPLASQRQLLNIVDAEKRAGITLTPTNLMIPRKSITAVLGVADIPVTGRRAGCNHCVMRDNCSYRKRGTTCDN